MNENLMEQRLRQVTTNGVPDRDKTQQTLSEEFELKLVARSPDVAPDTIVKQFARDYTGVLRWLGAERQDEILKKAQESTGIDLSRWIG